MTSVDELVDAWQAAWCGRDGDAFDAVCAPDLHYEDPVTEVALRGPAELAEHASLLWSGLPDARLETTGARLTDGRFVVAPCKLLGTHRADLGGLPASGRFVVVHAVFYCELDTTATQLRRVRGFFDAYDAAVQLGVLPRPGTLSERALMVMRGFGVRGIRRRA